MPSIQSVRPPVPSGTHGTDTSISSATPLTNPMGEGGWLQLQALTQNVRYTVEGTTPTATVGFQVLAGDMVWIPVGAGQVVNVIEETASASVQYQWYTW